MYRYLVLALALFAFTQARLDEESGTYDDLIPEYEHHPASGAMLMDDIEIDVTKNAVYYSSQLWTNGQIPYVIDSNYPTVVKDRILTSMREIEYDVNSAGTTDCIHFVARTNQANYIYVIPREHSCSSQVGFAHRGRQDVSIGKGCEHRGIIMHELMHAIGFWHEQSRPDRDNYVTIDLNNVASGHKHNYDTHSRANTLNTAYDYASIMHYNAYEFAVDRTHPVMTPKQTVPAGVKMGQRLQYSVNDVRKIQRLYKCHEDTSHVRQRVTNPADHCDFGTGFCALTQDTNDDFNWSRHRGSTPTGPGAGDSTGSDYYAVASASGHNSKYARLRTRTMTAPKVCVDYWFHNYGSSGSIKLKFVPEQGYAQTMRSYGHQRSRKWYHVYNTITVNGGGRYQLMFEAYTKSSDIALDDINIYEGQCM